MGETINGKIYSKLLDPIFEQLESKGFSCLHITRGISRYGEETYNNSLSYDHLRLFYYLYWRIKTIFLPFLYKIDSTIEFESVFFKAILATSTPRAIFCIGPVKNLCEQASCKGMKVIEVLHGIGYPQLPTEINEKRLNEQLPDIVLSFDDVSTKTISKLSDQNKLTVKQIDNYWYSKFQKGLIPSEWKNSIDKKNYKKVVLYSLQYGYDGDYEAYNDIISNGIIPNSILELIRRTEDEILWLLRLHPIQLRSNKYESHRLFIEELSLNHPNTEYQLSSVLPLPSILSFVDVHVSMMSMTSYDAAYFGLKSILLCPTLNTIQSSMFLDLQSKGYVKKIDIKNTEEILYIIEETNKIEPLVNMNKQSTLMEVLVDVNLLKNV